MQKRWCIGVLFLLACLVTSGQEWKWVKPYGSGWWTPSQIATDPAGNVFVAGQFKDTVRFDQAIITRSTDSTIFIAKLRPDGTLMWLKKRRGFLVDAIGIDVASSALYLAISDSAPTYYPPVKHLTKFDSACNKIWDHIIDGAWGEPRFIDAIKTDSSGNIFLIGRFSDTLTINGTSIYSNNEALSFVAKLAGNGNVTWLKQFPFNYELRSKNIVVAKGRIIIFKGDSLLTLDTSGNVLSLRHIVSYSSFYQEYKSPAMFMNASGDLFAGIEIGQDIDLGPYTFGDVAPCGQFWGGCGDVVGFKMTQAAQVTWAEHLYSYATDKLAATLVTQNGFLHVIGTNQQKLYVGDSTYDAQTTIQGGIFIASFNQNNSLYRINGVNGGASSVENCAVYQNSIYIVGSIDSGPVSFDSDTIRNYVGGFVGKYQVDPTVTGLTKFDQKQIQIYPNPTNAVLTISCDEKSRLIIYNTTGEKTFEKNLARGEFQVDVRSFAPGLYFCEVCTENSRYTRKIVKN